jgi:anti-sigma-K factor RskA
MSGLTALDDKTMAIGMLMEGAQAQQKLAQEQLHHLHVHTQELDAVVRDEIRRTLVDELQALHAEITRATRSLQGINRLASWRSGLYSAAIAVACCVAPVGTARWLLPTAAEIAALQAQRAELKASIASLQQGGARIELRRCGGTGRICVRVEPAAPKYGDAADFYVVHGY